MRWLVLSAVLVVSSSSAVAVTFDWVTVGDPGNLPDQLFPQDTNPDNLRFGSVDYTYNISKFELTNDEYVEFLNAVDAGGSNPNGVYHSGMAGGRGGIAFNGGAATGSKYSTKANFGNMTVAMFSLV